MERIGNILLAVVVGGAAMFLVVLMTMFMVATLFEMSKAIFGG